jgi:peptide/nickel transport system permease protein
VTGTAGSYAAEGAGTEPLRSWWLVSLRQSLGYGRTKAGLVITVFIVLVAVLGPLVAPHSPTELVGVPFSPPSASAPLGTDYVGEDVLSRVLSGGLSVLWMAFGAGFIGVAGGTALGVVAGFARPWADEAIMRSLDVLLAIPVVVFVLLVISMLGSSPALIVVLVGLSWMPTVARTVRAATLEIAHREFIEAAEVIGTPRRRILLDETLPNLMPIVLVELGLRCAWSIALVAVISYLGFGIPPPKADWGLMINENSIGLSIQPWAVAAPAACIALFSLGVSLLADGVSQAVSGIDRKAGS